MSSSAFTMVMKRLRSYLSEVGRGRGRGWRGQRGGVGGVGRGGEELVSGLLRGGRRWWEG